MKFRLTKKEIKKFCNDVDNDIKYMKFKDGCPYSAGKCGSIIPPSYCRKCYAEGQYNIKNGRSLDEFTVLPSMAKKKNTFHDITASHNKELANECKFNTISETCKYKDYWEKCAYCKKEFSR